MTPDQRLLQDAAKAMGWIPCEPGKFYMFCDEGIYFGSHAIPDSYEWNPLTDDGDALRLAVLLDMRFSFGQAGAMGYWESKENCFNGPIEYHFDGRQTKYEAARRAIVRAAAEIGKAMP